LTISRNTALFAATASMTRPVTHCGSTPNGSETRSISAIASRETTTTKYLNRAGIAGGSNQPLRGWSHGYEEEDIEQIFT
jgi:hypothetical protein